MIFVSRNKNYLNANTCFETHRGLFLVTKNDTDSIKIIHSLPSRC